MNSVDLSDVEGSSLTQALSSTDPESLPDSLTALKQVIASRYIPGSAEWALMCEEEEHLRRDRSDKSLLLHDLGYAAEVHLHQELVAQNAYAKALQADPTLQANLWSLKRILRSQRSWAELIRLLDIELYHTRDVSRQAELLLEKGHIFENAIGDDEQASQCYLRANQLAPGMWLPLTALERIYLRTKNWTQLSQIKKKLVLSTRDPHRKVALLLELAKEEEEKQTPGCEDRALSYLYSAYDLGVSIDQVLEEIVRITQIYKRPQECISALERQVANIERSVVQASLAVQPELNSKIVLLRQHQAHISMAEKDMRAAWGYLQEALRVMPSNAQLLSDLLMLALSESRLNEVASLSSSLQSLGEKNPFFLWCRASALYQIGKEQEARVLLATNEQEVPAFVLSEFWALREGNFVDLFALYHKESIWAIKGPDSRPANLWRQEILLRSAIVALFQKENSIAKELLEQSYKLGEKNSHSGRSYGDEIVEKLAKVHVLEKNVEGLGTILESFEKNTLRDARFRTWLVELLREKNDVTDAVISSLEKSVQFPTESYLWMELVDLSRQAGNVIVEMRALEHLVATDPSTDGALIEYPLRLAQLLAQQGDVDESVAWYEKVLQNKIERFQALLSIEQLWVGARRYKDFYELLQRQIELTAARISTEAQNEKEWLTTLLVKQFELVQRDEFSAEDHVKICELVLRNFPGCEYALFELVEIFSRGTENLNLIQFYEKQISEVSSREARADLWFRFGELYEHRKRWHLAEQAYVQALQCSDDLDPHKVHIVLANLRIQYRQGNFAKQRDAWRALANCLGSASISEKEHAWLCEEQAWALSAEVMEPTPELEALFLRARSSGDEVTAFLADLSMLQQAVLLGNEERQAKLMVDLAEQGTPPAMAAALFLRAGFLTAFRSREMAFGACLLAYQRFPKEPYLLMAFAETMESFSAEELLNEIQLQKIDVMDLARILQERIELLPQDDTDERVSLLWRKAELLAAEQTLSESIKNKNTMLVETLRMLLQLDPHHVAGWFLFRRTVGGQGDGSPQEKQHYALCTLKLAEETQNLECKVRFYKEAAQIFRSLNDEDSAVAALRAVLDFEPENREVFNELWQIFTLRGKPKEVGGQADVGPLLDLMQLSLVSSAEVR